MTAMAKPALEIQVDEATGEWSVDGMAMILVPRHFLVNNHGASEAAMGVAAYAKHLHEAGYKSAWQWCEKESARHGLAGLEVFHHYLKRLSQRGWAQFEVESVDEATGAARVRLTHSVFVAEFGQNAGRKVCYMFLGWLVGSLEYAGQAGGRNYKLEAVEVACCADGAHGACVLEVSPKA